MYDDARSINIQLKRKISVALLVLAFITGCWTATQYFAYAVKNHPILGNVLYHGAYTIYQPFAILEWYFAFYDYEPEKFLKSIDVFIYTWILFFPFMIWAGYRPKPETVHGTAHWLEGKEELIKAKLLPKKGEKAEGVIIGLDDEGNYLRHNGPEHLIVLAPTRSGKGVSLIIPTLLTWQHSTIVLDIKGENFDKTSGYRKNILKQKCLCFSPTGERPSCRFNPIAEIRIGTVYEVRDAQNLAQMLIDPEGKGLDDYWKQAGLGFLVGAILHICYAKRLEQKTATLNDLISFFTQPEKPFEEVLDFDMRQGDHVEFGDDVLEKIYGVQIQTHPKIAESAAEMLNKADKERAGVLSTAIANLSLYRDPLIAKYTSASDFSIIDLVSHETPVSLYLVIPPSDKNRLMPLMRIIVSLLITKLIGTLDQDGQQHNKKNRLLLMLDEFPNLGRLGDLEQAFAYIAGYGLKAFIIAQSLNQLNQVYGENNTITDNCHIRMVFAPNDPKTPEMVSKMLGTQTVKVINESWNGFKWLSQWHYSTSLQQRPLLTPDEVSRLPQEKSLIFVTGFPPLLANKNLYYEDPELKWRSEIEELKVSDIINIDSSSKEMSDV